MAIYMALDSDSHLQASSPSNQLCSAFLLPEPPQVLYQAPPGAQQLSLPDFLNVPQFGHIFLLLEAVASAFVLAGVVIGARNILSTRSVNDLWVTYFTYLLLAVVVHTICDIDPGESLNMPFLLAVEWTQAAPHSVRLNDVASKNIESMFVTVDTSQFDISLLKDDAP